MKSFLICCVSLFILPFELFSQCQNVPSHAVAWYDADNFSGSSVSDIRGGINGQMQNGAFIDTGYVCNAFNLDGTDDYISIPHNDSLTFSNGVIDRPFSIEAWINLSDVSTSMIFSKGDDMEREYSFRLTGTIADYLAVGLYDDRRSSGGNYNVIGLRSVYNFKLDENTWVHVACSYDGSGVSSGIKLYRNGAQLPTTVLVGTDSLGVYSAMRTTNKGATIGRFFTDGPQYLEGKVDELTVYSKELSSTEIFNIFQAGSDGKCITSIDSDTSGCHGDPFVSVKSRSVKNNLVNYISNAQNGMMDIVFNSNRSGSYVIYSLEGKEISASSFQSTNRLGLNFNSVNTGLFLIQLRTDKGEVETIKFLNK